MVQEVHPNTTTSVGLQYQVYTYKGMEDQRLPTTPVSQKWNNNNNKKLSRKHVYVYILKLPHTTTGCLP